MKSVHLPNVNGVYTKDPVFVKKQKMKCLIYVLKKKGGIKMDTTTSLIKFADWIIRTSYQDLLIYMFAVIGALSFSKRILQFIFR
jgi:hypothetical protein